MVENFNVFCIELGLYHANQEKALMSDWLWTWGGESFGYRDGDALFSQDGRQIGRFHDDEVYGVDGSYLGELSGTDRLLTRLSRVGKTRAPFSPRSRMGRLGKMSPMARAMRAGCQDFPPPSEL